MRSVSTNKTVAICLLVLVLTFLSLEPWGPIETREFSHLGPAVFWGFNAFLGALLLASFITIPLAWKNRKYAFWMAIILGWMFVIVLSLDLSHVFPTSPDSMGFLLGLIEIIDSILALYVIFFSHKALVHF